MQHTLETRIDRFALRALSICISTCRLTCTTGARSAGCCATSICLNCRAGGVGSIGAANLVEEKHLPELGLRVALDQVACLYEEAALAADEVVICRSYAAIEQARADGKIGVLIAMEGVEPLGTDSASAARSLMSWGCAALV
jgi:microsomal dipeptidase-like Zn-dependent dipeptidase